MLMLKKLSAATLIGKVPTRVIEIATTDEKTGEQKIEHAVRGIEQPLMRVVGLATGFKTGNTNFGQWFSFSGQFQATNIITGEVARSGNLFLPDVATDLMLPIVKENGDAGVEFAFDIGVRPFANAQGYEYTVTHLMDVAPNDPLVALAEKLLKNAPALPAPQKVAAIAAPETEIVGEPMAEEVKTNKKK